ncbi:hypothetical protein [Vagococcus fluvialis]|uniref:hypothetical protein n=1 Tax=Vagococcus fluvialis TaxID=2738 RepID=UPI0037BC1448
MKKILLVVLGGLVLTLLTACAGQSSKVESNKTEKTIQSRKKNNNTNENSVTVESSVIQDEIVKNSSTLNSSNKLGDSKKGAEGQNVEGEVVTSLEKYSNEQIEYSRVWLELGVHQDIDELNILKIPAGTLINPYDTTSSVYPVDSIQLTGSRLVDGSITYSSNGDGTITTYKVPTRWEQNVKVDLEEDYMKTYTKSLIDNGLVEHIKIGNTEDIVNLINIQNVH